ncbi:protocadherin alpha-8 [Xenopus tropicalis]|uniref:Protocadherin alpha-8 n=1 Tax=Xenopus tropicalis TaxID=8364 RepID=A0A8J0QRM4_XENTR|nr:protocadherin alpha-8 [Xenopus tropicalis]|eukprot:XP_002935957.3 PREDICTED: protocadherin alpha-8-like [Xenopus tropicalis]
MEATYLRWKYTSLSLAFCLFLLQMAWDLVLCQLHYIIPEESKHGTFVGRIAQDLGLEISEINSRVLRIVSRDEKEYFQVNLQNGILFVNNIIDREEICPETTVCIIHLEIIVDKPVHIYHVDVEIEDINDNYPVFSAKEYSIVIAESRVVESKFPLEGAVDEDVGTNSIRAYELSSNGVFAIEIKKDKHQSESVELVLKKPLDRENQPFYNLTLTAFDGGKPKLSGTTQLLITVQDSNDNAPAFQESAYEVTLLENAMKGTLVAKVIATDPDEGDNGKVTYEFSSQVPSQVRSTFTIDQETGEIRVIGEVDFEKNNYYNIRIDATDKGQNPMTGHCKILVSVIDINDNPPEMTVTSLSVPVPEDSPMGTTVAIIRIQDKDKDSGANGKVTCFIAGKVPFKLNPTLREYYALTVDGPLDREIASVYEVEIIARDGGSPVLSVAQTINVEISDVNDNAPSFAQLSDTIFITENNPPGSHVHTVSATDSDINQNSFITYSLTEGFIEGIPVSSYLSINPESGKIFALLSFDQEQIHFFQCSVKACDAGLAPLSGNLILNVFIVDVNDNAPTLFPPFSNLDFPVTEIVSRSAKIGHPVTKIRAVDADSGYNAFLSYGLKDPMEKTPFGVGQHTGEIVISRPVLESDRDEYKLFIVVKDHGDPVLSSTVTITIVLVEKIQDITVEQNQKGIEYEDGSNANIYLILAICIISVIFLLTLIVYTVIRWHQYSVELKELKQSNLGSSIAGSWTYSMQRHYRLWLNGITSKNDLIVFTPNVSQPPEHDNVSIQQGFGTGSSGQELVLASLM